MLKFNFLCAGIFTIRIHNFFLENGIYMVTEENKFNHESRGEWDFLGKSKNIRKTFFTAKNFHGHKKFQRL